MILTGPEIAAAAHDGRLRISPFAADQVNPNSYNVRLGPTLITYTGEVLDAHRPNPTRKTTIGPDGLVLQPDELYLGHTLEEVGSDTFVPLLFGRSSVGRLGLFVEITAPIGDIGFHGQWTLMLTPTRPLRVYPGMKIGQIMFFVSTGTIDLYCGKYQAAAGPQPSAYWRDVAELRVVAS
ncbi:dCTP deaminase [Streptomyces roseochromogenus]|uniref:Deoxycytidine triphosphate deaminase n=1 Tax=Streptomyces roseochromogenus subsp. oscitans DS 12.976 TaxID=1352936 RepID=V6KGR1_STRRC|nr:dCTP deaminase [Streptomyces roseochromogenus]EST30641.1 deoxycytidine triphosphate deaminase [Streptomyces roseochromogenus subsp. oscitans DS 12.976]